MKSLYRRYRPIKLQDVVGQDQVTKPLINALKNGKISHAYLLIGPRGCGKTSVARILAHEVKGFKYELEDDYVDIIEIDGASNRGIDNIRDLRDKAMIAPTKGKYKVYIIDEVHMLTKEAFNALLKTLEEPPAHVIFIMATTDAYKVPVTITSRAQAYSFKLADVRTMLSFLKQVVAQEKIEIDDGALEIVTRKGGGSFRDSLSLLDQLTSLSDGRITKQMVVDAIGLPNNERLSQLLEAYISHDSTTITSIYNELLLGGIKPETTASELISLILSQPKDELISLLSRLSDVKSPHAEARLLVALLTKDGAVVGIQPKAGQGLISTNHQQSFPDVDMLQNGATEGTAKHSMSPIAANRASESKNSSENLKATDHLDITKGRRENSVSSTSSISPNQNTAVAKSPSNDIEISPGPSTFNWTDYLDRVRQLSDAVYTQLIKTQYSFSNNTLTIYPMKRIIKSILSRNNNKKILMSALDQNVNLTILGEDQLPESHQEDHTLSQISDIMGGEVINDSGNSPF